MEFADLIGQRYSVRKFRQDPVSDADLEAILAAARLAPTAVNKQPQRIMVLRDAASLDKLRECTPYTFDAPLVLAVCFDRDEAWVRPCDNSNEGAVDAAIVGTHIMLAIANRGLGSTWVGYFDPAIFRRLFGLPDNIVPVALFPLGHPAPDAHPSSRHASRKPLDETVRYGGWR